MELNEKMQMLRKQKGITQEELAAALFVSRTAVSKWEAGRGYPSIASLQVIAKYFGTTVDDLLSTGEVLAIAEADTRQRKTRFLDLSLGLLDLCMAMLLFLPLFAERSGAEILSVLLFSLSRVYLKVAFVFAVLGTAAIGIFSLALQGFASPALRKVRTAASASLGVAAVLVFALCTQPYAAAFAFVLFLIKVLVLARAR
jgi:transcriptional regulator with XRE-family HTH domain